MQGYHFGVLKLDVKTKTATGVEFSSGGSSVIDTGKVRYLSGAVVIYATAGPLGWLEVSSLKPRRLPFYFPFSQQDV